jgi:hypothetical protein
MKPHVLLLGLLLPPLSAGAAVRVFVQDANGVANINYQCTAGEVVRAFALDVSVDHGQIVGVTNFLRGPSTAAARGYGIFPASFRDSVTVTNGTNASWNVPGYTPLAVVADAPTNTLPGLNSSGVTLEFGAVWDPTVPAAVPGPSGTLCTLQLNQTANITIAPNLRRGGLIAAPPDFVLSPQFAGALVGPAILSTSLTNGIFTIRFQDGELETADAPTGPWAGTGNTSGSYTEAPTLAARFFRVHHH